MSPPLPRESHAHMLARLFGRRMPPRSTREMVRVLRAAAQFSDASAEQREYGAAADALDRVLTLAERHSDAPTRDAFAYALGRAELDLGDKLAELIEISKEDHLLIQSVHTVQAEQGAAQAEQGAAAGALWAAFQSFSENLSQWREEIERWRGMVDATLHSFSAFQIESKTDRGKHTAQLSQIEVRLAQIEQLLAGAGQHEAGS